MSDESSEQIRGAIEWQDLTVANADALRDFYSQVAGWTSQPLDMGGYDDYVMMTSDGGQVVAGICHARGSNANLPPQWMVYINVDDIEASVSRCVELGGEIIDGPRAIGEGEFCVIRDPAGAVCALIKQ